MNIETILNLSDKDVLEIVTLHLESIGYNVKSIESFTKTVGDDRFEQDYQVFGGIRVKVDKKSE